MKLTMRWFGEADTVRLQQIAQVPAVKGIVGTLEGKTVDAVWTYEDFETLKQTVNAVGLSLDAIESIPVAEAIKRGTPDRDRYIDMYCESIRNMGRAGIPVLCYNFMPVFDWMRTDMAFVLPDHSVVTRYIHTEMNSYDYSQGLEARVAWAKGFTGEELQAALQSYKMVDEAVLFENLAYFLRQIVPVAEASGVYLALHPDDPPWSIFGLPRIVCDAVGIQKILEITDSVHHGVTFCTGSLGVLADNDLPAMVRQFGSRIHFVHLRNILLEPNGDFCEVAHPSACGSVDMEAVIEALIEIGFDGPIRPDHGRRIWQEETPRVGYGLYDRALGAMYLYGVWQGIHHRRTAAKPAV